MAPPGVTVTLDAAPTVGNVLVALVAEDDDSGPVFTLTNGTWTQVGSDVFAGNGTNWPLRMYRQTVTGSTTPATQIYNSGGGTGSIRAAILELSGVDTVDADIGSASNTATTTDTITPTAGLPAVIVSGAFFRSGTPAPAGSMVELAEVGTTSKLAVNYQEVTSTTGSYTVGSTGAGVNSSMIAAAFEDTGDSIIWVYAPLTIDDDDATFSLVLEEGIDAAAGVFWRGTLADELLIASVEIRVGIETAGANTITVQAGNEADYSDAVTIATIPFTATGTYTAQDIIDSWTPTQVYRYWQLVLTTTSDVTVFEVSLLDPEEGGGVTVHEDLTGRDDPDQHPADAVTVADSAGWFTAAEVEAALAEGAARTWGYQGHGNLGATETFNAATGWHSGTLNANCTISLTGAPSGTVSNIVLELAEDGTGGWTIDLPASVINAATLEADFDTTAGVTSLLLLMSRDGGTNWFGFLPGAGGGGTPATTVESETSFFLTPAVGTDTEYARQDHTHGSPGDAQLQAAGHYEVMMDGGSPPAALENGSGTDWLYVWVPA